MKIHTGNSRLTLPIRAPRQETLHFAEAEMSACCNQVQLSPGHHNWRGIRELDRDYSTLEVINDNGVLRLDDIDLAVQRKTGEWYSYQGDDFSSVRGETLWTQSFARKEWQVKTITRTVLRCDPDYFYLDAELDAYKGEQHIFSNNWNRRIKRNLV